MATIDTIESSDGVKLAFCLLIEGYDKAIVNDTSYDWATAYTNTDWSSFLTGLTIPDSLSEEIRLFSGNFSGGAASFVVQPDADDAFGIAVHSSAKAAGTETILDAELTNDPTDTITVKSTAGFASSGEIMIGTETIGYTSTTATTFGGTVTRGKYAAFKDAPSIPQRHPQSHKLTDYGVAKLKPRVTDYHRIWAGRKVRLMIHAISGASTIDSFEDAYTGYSGAIEEVRDGGSATVVDCKSMTDVIGDSVVFVDQFEAKVKEGIYLSEGQFFQVAERSVTLGTTTWKDTTPFTIVSSGATAGVSIAEGYYTAEEICAAVSDWLAAEKAASRLVGTWRARIGRVEGAGQRVAFSGVMASGTDAQLIIAVHTYGPYLGLPDGGMTTNWGETEQETATAFPDAPARVIPIQRAGWVGYQIDVEDAQGTWLPTGASWLPDPWDGLPESSTTWGYVLIDDVPALVRWDGSDTFGEVIGANGALYTQFGGSSGSKQPGTVPVRGLTIDDPGDVVVKQLAVVQGNLGEVMLRMLHSTDAGGKTALTYDDADFAAIGLALPGELFDSGTATDIGFLEGLADSTITVILDKPTTFRSLFESDMVLLGGYPMMHNGKLRFAGPTVAPGARAQYTLNTSNKATPADAIDSDRARSTVTTDLIRNRITVEYGRAISGDEKYLGSRSLVNAASITDLKDTRAVTIKARNTYGEDGDLAARVQDLLGHLGSFALGLFGYPVTLVTRTISRKLFGMMPGDLVTLTDDAVRNPLTGQRGVTSYPGWALEVSRDWSTGLGQVTLVLTSIDDESRYASYSPSAEIDLTDSNNYSASQTSFTTVANRFSLAGDTPDTDIGSFAVGDKIYFLEASPSNVAAASEIAAEIATVGTNAFTITAGVTLNASTLYYVVSQERSSAATSQQADTYIADASTALIESTQISNLWTSALIFDLGTPSAVDTTVRHKYPANEWATDGYPLAVAGQVMAADTATNLVNRRCAPQMPIIPDRSHDITGGGAYRHIWAATGPTYRVQAIFPVYLGIGAMSDAVNWSRQINVQPILTTDNGASTFSVRVTLSRSMPGGSSWTTATFVEPYEQVEFTTTSTTYASPTADTLRRIAGTDGVAFVTIECKGVSAAGYCYGLVQAWLGELA